MNDSQKHRSQLVLASIFAVFTLSLAIAGNLYYRGYEQRFRLEVERQLNAVAELKVGELVQWRRERMGDAAVLHTSPLFSTLIQRYFENPHDSETLQQLQSWLVSLQEAYQYEEVFLLDAATALRLAAPDQSWIVASDMLPVYTRALQTSEVTFLDFHRDAEGQPIHLSLLIPILDSHAPERAIALLVLRINPRTYLYPLINRWPTPSETAETLLVRREGDEVVFLNELRFQPDAALKLRFPLSSEKLPAALAASGQTGIVDGIDYRGEPVVADLRSVPDSPWFMVARMDAAEVYAPLRARLWELLAVLGILVAAAGAGVGMLWRQQNARYYQQQYEHQRERAWLQDIISRSLNEVYVFDPDTLHFLYANTGACRNIGYELSELARLTPVDIKPLFKLEAFQQMLEPLRAAKQEMLVFETNHRRKDGSEYPVAVHLQLVASSTGSVFLAIINDITERKRADERIRKLNRIYAVLSDINQAIVRIREPQALFDTACRIAVDKGNFQMAWIGLVDEATQRIQVAARYGQPDRYLDKVPLNNEAFIDGPIDRALLARQHVFYNRVEHAERLSPFQNLALELGCRSYASFPLVVSGAMRGTFTLYADAPDFFDEEELKLLDELSMDLSFAMEFTEKENERERAEQAMRASEEHYRSTLDNMLEGIQIIGFDWRYLYLNDAAARIGRQPKQELLGHTVMERYPGIENTEMYAVLRRCMDERTAELREFEFTYPDGEISWFEQSVQPVPEGIFILSLDISERKKVEAALHESAETLQTVIETSPLAIIVTDDDGKVTLWNHAAETIFGWSASEVIGEQNPILPPDKYDEVRQVRRQIVAGQTFVDVETERMRKDGARIAVSFSATALRDPANQASGILAIVSDITEKKQAEEAISSLAKFPSENPGPVLRIHQDGRLLYANQACTSLSPDWQVEVGQPAPAPLRQVVAETLASGESKTIDTQHEIRIISFFVAPVREAGYANLYGQDVTERRHAETEIRVLNTQLEQRVAERSAELEARNRELETFTYSVSHDLKAPLRGIDGYSRLLLEDYAGALDEEGRTFLNTIRKATLQMNELIDGLLAYSRLERRPLQSSLVDLRAMVESLLNERQAEIQDRHVQVSVQLPEAALRADPDGLTMAMRNLLDNALKFTAHNDHPVIKIEGRETASNRIISVSDNGAGFDTKFHDRIFDIFQRLHRAEDYPGTGVGLAIVRKALERMGGRAWAESEPGKGATFYLEVPK